MPTRRWDLVYLGTVDQSPQCDVDPGRRLLSLEFPNVVRGLGDNVAHQPEGIAGVEVEHEGSQHRARVLIGGALVVFDVVEHESHRGLGFEDGRDVWGS